MTTPSCCTRASSSSAVRSSTWRCRTNLVARLEGKSSLGRIGLLIHSTAGYVDPGWKGQLTLELSNVSNLPITLYHRMKIGQISFLRLTTPAEHLYGATELGSKYQGQTLPTASRVYEEYGPGGQ